LGRQALDEAAAGVAAAGVGSAPKTEKAAMRAGRSRTVKSAWRKAFRREKIY
jgi:hypothetical protein